MRVRAIYADFFSCVRGEEAERERRVEWPEFEFKRRGRGGNPRERSGGSRLKRRGPPHRTIAIRDQYGNVYKLVLRVVEAPSCV